MKKIRKGEFGYLKYQTMFEIIKTLVLLALCIGIYYLGIYSTGDNKNLLTFVAVLGVLPMARCAVTAVLFVKSKHCSKELYDELTNKGLSPDFYDLFLTDYKVNYQLSALILRKGCVAAYSEDPRIDTKAGEEHIEKMLKNAGFSDLTIKIFTDKDKFITRLSELSQFEISEEGNSREKILENILSISI